MELTPLCRLQLKPGGKLSYTGQRAMGDDLCGGYTVCLCLTTPAKGRQLLELKGQLEEKLC